MDLNGSWIDGVTNEEVMKALIHRIKFLNEEWLDGKFNCPENTSAIDHLQLALEALENRTKNRFKRNVEGTHNA